MSDIYNNYISALEICRHCFSIMEKAIMDFRKGLQTFGIQEYMKKYPEVFRTLLCKSTEPVPLTVDIFDTAFQAERSVEGSKNYSLETRALGYFRDYLADCEGNHIASSLLLFFFIEEKHQQLVPVFRQNIS